MRRRDLLNPGPRSHRLAIHWNTLRAVLAASGVRRGLRQIAILALIALVMAALVAGYLSTQTPLTLSVDGEPYVIGTHQATVGAALRDAGVVLQPEDFVSTALDAPVTPGLHVEVRRAYSVTIHVDGRVLATRTRENAPLAILERMGVRVGPSDEVLVDGQELPSVRTLNGAEQLVSAVLLPGASGGLASQVLAGGDEDKIPPGLIEIRRAVEIILLDDGLPVVIQTTQPTLGEALHKAGIVLYLGDSVQPPLWTRVSAGLTVEIRRSVPVSVTVDGHNIRTRTFRNSVAEVLADTGVALVGEDYSLPMPDSAITPELNIKVVRVKSDVVTEQETFPYETVLQGDGSLEIDHQRVNQYGEQGVRQRRIRVRYEDGLEVSRAVEDEWVLKEPVTQINAYGTQIVIRTLQTADGPVEYWRVIPMLATSYSASTAGTPRSSPHYGRTAVGWPMRHGLVAVDPSVIPMFTQLYVPGYGVGIAADTGSAIKNRRIDLGYDDDNLRLWYSWVDVYVLTPVPDPSRIQYIIGNWPPSP